VVHAVQEVQEVLAVQDVQEIQEVRFKGYKRGSRAIDARLATRVAANGRPLGRAAHSRDTCICREHPSGLFADRTRLKSIQQALSNPSDWLAGVPITAPPCHLPGCADSVKGIHDRARLKSTRALG